jgi:hypothetical protein
MADNEQLNERIRALKGLLVERSRNLDDAKATVVEFWQRLAGPQVSEMLVDIRVIEKALDDTDPKLRYVALSSMLFYKGGDDLRSISHKVERLSLTDNDDSVRLAAVGVLGKCYMRSNDQRVGKFLATIVSSPDYSVDFRRAAYRSLCFLRGVSGLSHSMREAVKSGQLFDTVDWEMVRSFLDNSSTA